jgi:hypothetical protein
MLLSLRIALYGISNQLFKIFVIIMFHYDYIFVRRNFLSFPLVFLLNYAIYLKRQLFIFVIRGFLSIYCF